MKPSVATMRLILLLGIGFLIIAAPQVARAQRCAGDSLLTYIVRDERGQVLDASTKELIFEPKGTDWNAWRVSEADFLNRGYFSKEMIPHVPSAIAQLNGKTHVLVTSTPCGFTETIKLQLTFNGKKMRLIFRPQALNDRMIDYMVDSVPFQSGIFDMNLTLEKDDRRSAYFYEGASWLKETEADEAYYDGQERLEKKDYENAIKFFQLALMRDPKNLYAAFFTGDANISLKRYDAAITALKQATAINPQSAISYSLLGTAYRLNHQHKEAVDAYSTALSIGAKDKDWSEGWDKNTHDYLKKSQHALDPNYQKSAEYYFDEGEEYVNNKKFPEAVESLKQAVKLKPDYAFAYAFLGQAYRNLNRNDEAIEALKEAVRLDPNSAPFHGVLGETYLELKRYSESAAELNSALVLAPGNQRWRDDLTEAQDGLKLEAQPKTAQDYFDEGMNYFGAKKYREAIESLEKATKLKPDYAQALTPLGIAYIQLEMYEEAIAPLQAAIRLEPSRALSHGALGQAYFNLGRNKEATSEFKEAARLQPAEEMWRDGLNGAMNVIDGPPREVIEREAERLWRLNNPAYVKDAVSIAFKYPNITVKRQRNGSLRPAGTGTAGNSIDPLYSASIKLIASATYTKPREFVVDYKEADNLCFYKKSGETTWSAAYCELATVTVDPKILDQYVGEYQMPATASHPQFVLKVFREGDKLISEAFGRRAEFLPFSDTEFFMEQERVRLHFVRDEQGKVTHIDWGGTIVKRIK